MFWNTSMHYILCVLTIAIKLQYSYAEFTCRFGRNTGYKTNFTNCGIARTPLESWANVSGHGYRGYAPSGQKNDGFLVTRLKRSASLELPRLYLLRNSGILSFHYKFYSLSKSILEVSVCPGGVRVRIPDNDLVDWQKRENIAVYCDGREPQIRFFASEINNKNRIAFDNIKVVSTSPPSKKMIVAFNDNDTNNKEKSTNDDNKSKYSHDHHHHHRIYDSDPSDIGAVNVFITR
ncbi:uncharacterized protein LOC121431261 [Lytechinus variegatus]|uniref:uncharacterized protein LOC121431261 n=1 Tax=Lytechinus variegatus TaxID=7654 RepID=UPI001BB1BB27|nr:uncharacterized protein LOC121431261 [Lytechinus variegatus]